MNFVQKCFPIGLLMVGGLLFAGCGVESTEPAKPDPTKTETETMDDANSKTPDNASIVPAGFQLVSLNVPKMV